MKLKNFPECFSSFLRLLTVHIKSAESEPDFCCRFRTRSIFQNDFKKFCCPVIFSDEGKPGNKIIPVSFEIKIGNFILPLNNRRKIDPADMSLDQSLKNIKFFSVKLCFSVTAGGIHHGICFENRIIRLNKSFFKFF